MTHLGPRPTRRQVLGGAAGVGVTAVGLALWAGGVPLAGRGARAEPPLVGYLLPVFEEEARTTVTAFRDGLGEQGLVEGRDVRLVVRFGEGRPERLPDLAAELLGLQVRVIVAFGGTPTLAARQATDRVPIVSINGPDLVAAGWARSLARPGGNVTGLTASTEVKATKNVELLTETVPAARRLTYLANSSLGVAEGDAIATAAAQLGLELLVGDVQTQGELEPAFERARAWGADLLYAQNVIPLNVPRERLPELARRTRLPAAAGARQWVAAGFLLGYEPNVLGMVRRGARHVARILGGADPAELPIERPAAYELVVNRGTLAHLGLTLPPHVAAQVTEWVG